MTLSSTLPHAHHRLQTPPRDVSRRHPGRARAVRAHRRGTCGNRREGDFCGWAAARVVGRCQVDRAALPEELDTVGSGPEAWARSPRVIRHRFMRPGRSCPPGSGLGCRAAPAFAYRGRWRISLAHLPRGVRAQRRPGSSHAKQALACFGPRASEMHGLVHANRWRRPPPAPPGSATPREARRRAACAPLGEREEASRSA